MKKGRTLAGDGRILILAAIFIISLVFCYVKSDFAGTPPWQKSFSGQMFSFYTEGENGDSYTIDTGGMRVISADKNGTLKYLLDIDYVTRDIAVGAGSIYTAQYDFFSDNTISRMSVEVYSADRGKKQKTLLAREFAQGEGPSYNAGMLGFTYIDGYIYYMEKSDDNITASRVSADTGEIEPLFTRPYENADKMILNMTCDYESGAVYVLDKTGHVFAVDVNGAKTEITYSAEGVSVPFDSCVSGGRLYVSDVGLNDVYVWDGQAFSLAIDLDESEYLKDTNLYSYWISPLPDGSLSLTNVGFTAVLDPETGEIAYCAPTELALGLGTRTLLWLWYLCAAYMAFMVLSVIMIMVARAYRKLGSEKLLTNLLMVVLVVAVTALIIFEYTSSNDESNTQNTINRVEGLATLTASLIDGDELAQINTPEDYGTENYRALEKTMASVVSGGKESLIYYYEETGNFDKYAQNTVSNWDEGVYRSIIRVIDGRVCYVYTSEDQYGALYPLSYPYEGTEFQVGYEHKTGIAFVNVKDYSGQYTYTNAPIFDSNGEVAGVLEMGVDQRAYTEKSKALTREVTINVVITSLVVLLLLREFLYFVECMGKRARRGERRGVRVETVRPLVFMCYLADSFALIISPLFARALYTENLGIPMEVGVAIACSMTFLFVGVAAFAGGRAMEKRGIYPILLTGILLMIASEIVAATSHTLIQFICAKALTGLGAGLLLNVTDTLIATQEKPEDVEKGFSLSSVGMYAGTNCGVVLGSLAGASWGYNGVYWLSLSVCVLMLMYTLFMFRKDAMPMVKREAAGKISAGKFLMSKNVLTFFALISAPYLIVNAFVDYFLPMQGAAVGFSEEDISRVVFIYGMISIYLGPVLTSGLGQRFKAKGTMLLSAAMAVIALGVYAYSPSNSTLIAGVMIFALANGCGFSMQNVYYSQLPECVSYGAGAALGMSNIINGLASTFSSYCFAFAMVFGARTGIAVIAGIFLVMIALFFAANRKPARG